MITEILPLQEQYNIFNSKLEQLIEDKLESCTTIRRELARFYFNGSVRDIARFIKDKINVGIVKSAEVWVVEKFIVVNLKEYISVSNIEKLIELWTHTLPAQCDFYPFPESYQIRVQLR